MVTPTFEDTSRFSDEQIQMFTLLYGVMPFPQIACNVEVLWGSSECRKYMYGLTVENTGKIRRGFPFPVLEAIVNLLALHDECYPMFAPVFKSWEQSTF